MLGLSRELFPTVPYRVAVAKTPEGGHSCLPILRRLNEATPVLGVAVHSAASEHFAKLSTEKRVLVKVHREDRTGDQGILC